MHQLRKSHVVTCRHSMQLSNSNIKWEHTDAAPEVLHPLMPGIAGAMCMQTLGKFDQRLVSSAIICSLQVPHQHLSCQTGRRVRQLHALLSVVIRLKAHILLQAWSRRALQTQHARVPMFPVAGQLHT